MVVLGFKFRMWFAEAQWKEASVAQDVEQESVEVEHP